VNRDMHKFIRGGSPMITYILVYLTLLGSIAYACFKAEVFWPFGVTILVGAALTQGRDDF
jgi:hypothetical protein